MFKHYQMKHIAFWCLFIFLDLLIIGAICEIYVRLFVPTMNVCYDVNPDMGVTLCPNQETYGYVEGDYVNIFRTNSDGYHDYEFVKEKTPETMRIHIYGDSLVQGKGVPMADTVPKIIEGHLNTVMPGKGGFEVMNLASGDDSTICQIRTYEVFGRDFKPDLVICYFDDDFGDNIFEVNGIAYTPYYEIGEDDELVYIPPRPKGTASAWEWFKQNSRLYRLFANKLFESRFYHDLKFMKKSVTAFLASISGKQDESRAFSHKQYVKDMCTTKSWPLTLRLIRHFNDIVVADGADFILVDGLKFNDNFVGETYSNRDLEIFCREAGIAYIPGWVMHNALNEREDRRDYFFRDNHPTALSNRLISEYVAERMIPFLEKHHIE